MGLHSVASPRAAAPDGFRPAGNTALQAHVTANDAPSNPRTIGLILRGFWRVSPVLPTQPQKVAAMRQTLSRGLLILVTLLVAAVYYMPIGHVDFAENWGEGSFGITIPQRGTLVVAVVRGSSADRAGVRAGDVLSDRGDFGLAARVRSAYAGERERLTFARDTRSYTVTL